MLDLGKQLGLQFQDSKVEGPTTTINFLGIELDSVAMEACLSPRKLEDLHNTLLQWSNRSHCTLRELEQLTGYLQFCSQVIPLWQAFIRALYDFQSTFRTPLSCRRIPATAWKDLKWWLGIAINWNGVRFISPKRQTCTYSLMPAELRASVAYLVTSGFHDKHHSDCASIISKSRRCMPFFAGAPSSKGNTLCSTSITKLSSIPSTT
jgi:hypothetical protein